MNTNIDPLPGLDLSEDRPRSSEPHDFNMDGIIANNFGHGDDHSPPNLTHGPGLLPDSDRSQPHTSS